VEREEESAPRKVWKEKTEVGREKEDEDKKRRREGKELA
jgi:hypothetical protein